MGGEVEDGYKGYAHEYGPGEPGCVQGGGGEGLNAGEKYASDDANYVIEDDSLQGVDVVAWV